MSPVKFSNIVFPVWNFMQSLKFYYKTSAMATSNQANSHNFKTLN